MDLPLRRKRQCLDYIGFGPARFRRYVYAHARLQANSANGSEQISRWVWTLGATWRHEDSDFDDRNGLTTGQKYNVPILNDLAYPFPANTHDISPIILQVPLLLTIDIYIAPLILPEGPFIIGSPFHATTTSIACPPSAIVRSL
jgi:hypothetical protein